MATIKKFTGFTILQNNDIPLRRFIGFSAETLENFTIRVVDNLGNLVPNSTIEITFGGIRNEYLAENGSISLYIENPINVIRVNAFKDCLFGVEKIVSHGGDGFFVAVEIQIAELPCLEPEEFNAYNFLRFKLSNNLSFPIDETVTDCTNCNTDGAVEGLQGRIPNSYSEYYDRNLCKKMFPLLVRGEEYGFVINDKILINTNTLNENTIKLCLVDKDYNQIVLSEETAYLTPADGDGKRQIYANFKINNEQLTNNKNYRVVVYNSLSNLIVFVSNEVQYVAKNYGYRSVYLKYRNSSDLDGFAYSEIPDDFYNAFRLEITKVDAQPETELLQYEEESTGRTRNQQIKARKIYKLESQYFEEDAHDAMHSFSLHDDITVNGLVLKVKSGYKVTPIRRSNVYKGEIEMYEQKRSTVNSSIQ